MSEDEFVRNRPPSYGEFAERPSIEPTYEQLRARVAKLEAALIHARGVIGAIMSDGNCDCRKDFAIIDAALSETVEA